MHGGVLTSSCACMDCNTGPEAFRNAWRHAALGTKLRRARPHSVPAKCCKETKENKRKGEGVLLARANEGEHACSIGPKASSNAWRHAALGTKLRQAKPHSVPARCCEHGKNEEGKSVCQVALGTKLRRASPTVCLPGAARIKQQGSV